MSEHKNMCIRFGPARKQRQDSTEFWMKLNLYALALTVFEMEFPDRKREEEANIFESEIYAKKPHPLVAMK